MRRSWEEWQAWLEGPVRPTIINEPIEPEPESATAKARRRWNMDEEDRALVRRKVQDASK